MTDKNVTNIMPDASEIVHYDRQDFPVYIKDDDLSEYPGGKALCHWHEDIELICIIEGMMNYYVNGKTILLTGQDCLIVNSRQLHYGHSHLRQGCRFICVRFHPRILGSSPAVFKDYVAPFTDNHRIEYLHYPADSPNHKCIRESIIRMLSLKTGQEAAFELDITSTLYSLWRTLFCQCRDILTKDTVTDDSDLALQKKMVSYIYEHYQEPLTLGQISAFANISRSKCCLIFQQYLQQPPIDFLNKYRLEVSRNLLATTSSSITEIALSCGFNHLSYYSKIFFREYGCTPTRYRNSRQGP